MEASSPCYVFSLIFFLFFFLRESVCQFAYVGNGSCSINDTSTPKEYLCVDSIIESCDSYYLTFKSPPHSYYFSYTNITLGNNILFSTYIYPCECLGGSFQNLLYYTIESGDSYEKIVNDYFQGLTSCSALRTQNHDFAINSSSSIGRQIVVPLRCACPTKGQQANGTESLAMYVLQPNQTIGSVARDFGVEKEIVLEANNLSNSSHAYPFMLILVPLGKDDICRIFGCDSRWRIQNLMLGGGQLYIGINLLQV